MLLLIEIHQDYASQTPILLCITIFRNWSRDFKIKMAVPITVILKHFKACIFEAVSPIFIKFLPSIMVCKTLSAEVTLIFCVHFHLIESNIRAPVLLILLKQVEMIETGETLHYHI